MTNIQNVNSSVRDAYETVWRNRFVVAIVFIVLLSIAIVYVMRVERQFVAGANVLVVNGNTRDDPTLSSPDLPSIATSTVVLDRVVKNLQLDLSLLTIKKHLTVKPPAFRSSIIRVEYADTIPDRAALIANSVADELTKYYGEISTARYDADLSALDVELAKESGRIKNISAQMQARGGSAVTSIDDKGNDPVAGRLASLQTDLALSQATLAGDAASAAAAGVSAATNSKLVRHEVLQNDPTYRGLQVDASTSDVTLANERAVYTEHYPGFAAINAKVKSLHASLDNEAARALASADAYSPSAASFEAEQRKAGAIVVADRARVSALQNLVAGEQARQAAQTPLEALRLQRESAQAEYLSISAHRATALAARADALSLGSAVVVDRAISSEVQVGLGRTSLSAILLMLVIVLSLGSAFIADLLNPRLRRIAQIENLYGRPVIATIGKM